MCAYQLQLGVPVLFSWVIGYSAHGTGDLPATQWKGNSGTAETAITEACQAFSFHSPLHSVIVSCLFIILCIPSAQMKHYLPSSLCVFLMFLAFLFPRGSLLHHCSFISLRVRTSSAPTSRLHLWKCPCNFLLDYSDGFI